LLKLDYFSLPLRARAIFFVLVVALLSLPRLVTAQSASESPYFARVNTFGFFAAYSNDSSHILLGTAERRKLMNIGASYNRRLFLDDIVSWQYNAELMPVALEGDPLSRFVNQQTSPTVATITTDGGPMASCAVQKRAYTFTTQMGVTYSGTAISYCHGRQWTVGEAMSPIGSQWNFRPRHVLQPFVLGHVGYMYSTHAIPVEFAGSFNFTFDVGAGLELYQSKHQSIRAEYRYHHISNHNTANDNPGIDSGLLQLTYAFGR
jgi:opacity protein-like surface antigen